MKKGVVVNIGLIILVIILVTFPLILKKGSEFEGTDDKAKSAISQINKDYKPWVKPIVKPPSKKNENLLFTLQAALGTGFIGYYFGYARGKRKGNKSERSGSEEKNA